MGHAKLYAKVIKKEARRKESRLDNVSTKDNLWLSFFRRLSRTVPKGFYQYLERNELKNQLLNSLEGKAERAYKNNTMAADELRAALTNLESFYNKQINAYLASKQDKHKLQSNSNKL